MTIDDKEPYQIAKVLSDEGIGVPASVGALCVVVCLVVALKCPQKTKIKEYIPSFA